MLLYIESSWAFLTVVFTVLPLRGEACTCAHTGARIKFGQSTFLHTTDMFIFVRQIGNHIDITTHHFAGGVDSDGVTGGKMAAKPANNLQV